VNPLHVSDDSVIEVRDVSKSYGPLRAVNCLSFTVGRSTCVGLLGPNGAGKTTMLKMIYAKCLRDREPPRSSILVFGHDPARNELDIKFLSGVVPQEDNLDEELDVRQNLFVYARLYGMQRRAAERRIGELLDFMELGEKRAVKIKELSGGMKRRLIIARALLNSPHLLILDEPTTGLDPQVRHLIWDKLRQLKREGLTILLTTHYMEEAAQICDSVLIMHKGAKVMEGAPEHLVRTRIERYVLEARHRDALPRAEEILPGLPVRMDATMDSLRFFSQQDGALRELAARLGPGEYRFRETNLEDLFLQATGSALGDQQ
jgi:lipooligosaccharide transport system ATP-binding protein